MWWLLWCIMYGIYVHIKAVTYVTFPNKQRFLPNTYIFLLYAPIMCVMYYLVNWIWLWNMLVEKCRKEPSLPCEKRITKTQELWTYTWCHNALWIVMLMTYGIINLHNHMYFFRYIDALTIHSGVSFPLIVLIHVTWIVYKKSLF